MGSTAAAALLAAGCLRAAQPPAQESASARPPSAASSGERGAGVPPFRIRPGYKVTLAASELENARFMEFGARGELYLSRPQAGDILMLRDADGDGAFEKKTTFVAGKPTAHGLCFYDGWLWWTQSQAIHRSRDTDGDGKADETVTVLGPEAALPGGSGHWWRSILVTSDGFYTSVGDGGNINDETATDRQKIWHYQTDGSGKKLFASGLRNTEKLRLRPGTSDVYGCDHGSDWFGRKLGESRGKQPVTDRNPPCEFNRYVQDGFYGHPFVVGDKLPRIEYQDRPDIIDLAARAIAPEWEFGAHWAPNGFCFISKDHFGAERKGDAVVSFHGSWNSSSPVGYRVQLVQFDQWTGKPAGSFPLVITVGTDNTVHARPVDAVEAPDGTLLFSCDVTNSIYRISKSR